MFVPGVLSLCTTLFVPGVLSLCTTMFKPVVLTHLWGGGDPTPSTSLLYAIACTWCVDRGTDGGGGVGAVA